MHNAPDFIIESGQKVIAVEVKITLRMKSDVRGHSREKLNNQVKKYASCEDVTDIIVLGIALGNFPTVVHLW